MKKYEKLSNQFAIEKGNDCLCQRTSPGTHYEEHIYCFCGCTLGEAYVAGFLKARELAIQQVRETEKRFGFQSVANLDGYTLPKGMIDITLNCLGEEKVE